MFPDRLVRLKDGRSGTIRAARREDAEAWIENANRVAAEGIYLMTERFHRGVAEVQAQFAGADPSTALWLVAEIDGRIVGGANFQKGRWAKNAHTAELGMSVRSEYRGLGFGSAILAAGIDWAKQAGVRKVRLGVFATNEPAIGLYRKFGFREEGRLREEVVLNGRPVDEVLMALWIR